MSTQNHNYDSVDEKPKYPESGYFGPLPLGSEDSYFKAFGPKNHMVKGFWAVLSLRVRVVVNLRISGLGLMVHLGGLEGLRLLGVSSDSRGLPTAARLYQQRPYRCT